MAFDTELFIDEIKKRPALFNTKIKDYSDKSKKKKLWSELCQQFIENWDELGDRKKIEKSK